MFRNIFLVSRKFFSFFSEWLTNCESCYSPLKLIEMNPSSNPSTCRYLKQNARKSELVSNITDPARTSLNKWLEADNKLYTHFVKKLNHMIDRWQNLELEIKFYNFLKIWKRKDGWGCSEAATIKWWFEVSSGSILPLVSILLSCEVKNAY